ncbi:hypothetical protein FSP39_003221 [Pinctada imbricata]|uniref:NOL1/NOP2/Sun domain family member 4 n=1 Tax=Pinctada imbricata TaxID=66713 RepID=A0AA89BUR4_PINIB|nr:hypothetical protein FSP39_003221 [Pinctada imbricata]
MGRRLNTDIALQNFDMFYKPVYGELWPSLRVSLLTSSKYCALLNTYHTEQDKIEEKLVNLGCQNGMAMLSAAFNRLKSKDLSGEGEGEGEGDKYFIKEEVNLDVVPSRPSEKMIDDDEEEDKEENLIRRAENEPIREKNTSLFDFVPADEVFTEKEKLIKAEFESSVYRGNSELVCNDLSKSRLNRLQNTLEWYLGERNPSYINISNQNAVHFQDSGFDKVLVDVPCNTDRHVVAVEENNLFKPGRLHERLTLSTTQRNLLVSGIKACSPGGSVVYSTCTLSPAQNDGVVQAACEYIWKETDIDIAVVDLDFIPAICGDIFKFYKGCRYGQLVIPSLSCNFGPMYFCKIKRLN